MTADARNYIHVEVISKMASNGLRTICLGYRDFKDEPNFEQEEEVTSQLTLVGSFGIEDPVGPEVYHKVPRGWSYSPYGYRYRSCFFKQ